MDPAKSTSLFGLGLLGRASTATVWANAPVDHDATLSVTLQEQPAQPAAQVPGLRDSEPIPGITE